MAEDDYKAELLLRAKFHAFDDGDEEEVDKSGHHTTRWVPMGVLMETETPTDVQAGVRADVQKFLQLSFEMMDYEFDLKPPTSRRRASHVVA